MDYIVVANTEWAYPDRAFSSYLSGSDKLTGATARNSIVGAQILLQGLPQDGSLDVALEGLERRDATVCIRSAWRITPS